jgi:hexosaminidase
MSIGQSVVWAITIILALPLCHALHAQIPSIDESDSRPHDAPFIFSPDTQIVVLSGFPRTESPSLLDYASTFRTDLQSVLALASPPLLSVRKPNFPASPYPVIVLATGAANFSYFSGQPTGEGYTLDVAQKRVTIRGADALGAWWGTRTLLQQLVAARNGSIKQIMLQAGTIRDSPGWPVRGFMLDAGRHWFEPQFIGRLPSSDHTRMLKG